MYRTLSLLAALVFCIGFAGSVLAADEGKKPPQGGGHPGRGLEHIQSILSQLDLSDEQKSQAKEILVTARAKLKEIIDEARASGDREAAQPKIRALMQETRQQLVGLLTPEQKEKFRELMQAARKEGEGNRADRPKKDGAGKNRDGTSGDKPKDGN